MDTPKILRKDEAIELVRRYKEVIAPRFEDDTKVMMFGSYSKGHPNEWSDIDVAVIVPKIAEGKWLEWSTSLWHDVKQVSLLIEPVLLEQNEPSPLYRDVMKTGVAI
ncbi:MAG: nucleotidyltransferase domain-containing protein [Prevotella sp.]|nr:nucleotidyltransferase domain-containing protein [Prevotella sp.]